MFAFLTMRMHHIFTYSKLIFIIYPYTPHTKIYSLLTNCCKCSLKKKMNKSYNNRFRIQTQIPWLHEKKNGLDINIHNVLIYVFPFNAGTNSIAKTLCIQTFIQANRLDMCYSNLKYRFPHTLCNFSLCKFSYVWQLFLLAIHYMSCILYISVYSYTSFPHFMQFHFVQIQFLRWPFLPVIHYTVFHINLLL